ncbi:MFS transporter [Roseomonas elaeocarpi]|uniref:MFS transporter n=1 Tax=Roseomonas elaeocarpi TaxID=907779 RepID=A0ABV6JWA1_9PROT
MNDATPSRVEAPLAVPSTARLVLVFGLAGFASALTTRALDPLLLSVAADFSASTERVALLASAYALPYALIQPLLGPVGDALGKRRVIVVCALLLTAALLLGAFANSLPLLFASRILAGLAAGGITPLALATFGDAVPMAQRQVAMSRFMACAIGGQVAGGALSGLFAGVLGWRGVLAACALATLLAGLVLRWDARRAPDPARGRLDPSLALLRYREILTNPLALRLFGGVAVEGLLVFGIFPFLAAILALRGIGGTAEAGLALGAFGLGGFGYAALAPLLVRGIGQENMMRLGGACAAAGLILVAIAPALAVVVLATLVLGLGYFMLHNSIQVRVTEVAPLARGSAVALHAFSFFMGQSLGPALFALAQTGFGTVPTLAASAVGLVVLGFWLAAAVGRTVRVGA